MQELKSMFQCMMSFKNKNKIMHELTTENAASYRREERKEKLKKSLSVAPGSKPRGLRRMLTSTTKFVVPNR